MKSKVAENIRGEMSVHATKVSYPSMNLNWLLDEPIDKTNEVSATFIRRPADVHFLQESMRFRRSLLPWVISSCAQTDDINTLQKVQQTQSGAQFNVLLPGGSMPLHICAKHSSVKCAEFLLRIATTNEQSIVNETDHVGLTPLFYAILRENDAMIELLTSKGADLKATLTPSEIGMYLCNCAKNNQVSRLRTWHKAGADLDQTDYDGRTALLLVKCSLLVGVSLTARCRRSVTIPSSACATCWTTDRWTSRGQTVAVARRFTSPNSAASTSSSSCSPRTPISNQNSPSLSLSFIRTQPATTISPRQSRSNTTVLFLCRFFSDPLCL